MKKLILATASVLALGLAGAGAGHAQTTSPSTTPPSSAAMPQQGQNMTTQGAAQGTWSKEQIEDVQQKLKSAGVYNGAIDGQMGPQTKEAITDFQKQKGLEQTGTLDQQTMAALNQGASSTTSTSGSSTQPSEK